MRRTTSTLLAGLSTIFTLSPAGCAVFRIAGYSADAFGLAIGLDPLLRPSLSPGYLVDQAIYYILVVPSYVA